MTTKIHLLVDALGRPLRLILTPGQAADIKSAPALLEGMSGKATIADKAYDADALRALIASAGMEAVIPPKRSRTKEIAFDAEAYRLRNLIERCFNKLKHFRRIATRFDRLDTHFMAFLHFASAMIWMR